MRERPPEPPQAVWSISRAIVEGRQPRSLTVKRLLQGSSVPIASSKRYQKRDAEICPQRQGPEPRTSCSALRHRDRAAPRTCPVFAGIGRQNHKAAQKQGLEGAVRREPVSPCIAGRFRQNAGNDDLLLSNQHLFAMAYKISPQPILQGEIMRVCREDQGELQGSCASAEPDAVLEHAYSSAAPAAPLSSS